MPRTLLELCSKPAAGNHNRGFKSGYPLFLLFLALTHKMFFFIVFVLLFLKGHILVSSEDQAESWS